MVMGGSATAVQAGGEAYKYYSEPNQLANRIMTLQGIVDVLLEKFQSMRESTLVPYLDRAVSELEAKPPPETMISINHSNHDMHKKAQVAVGATCLGSTAATSAAASLAVQEGAMAGRFVSRATTAAARTARFARFAGGALSAATLVLEARELRRTLDQMEQGNPCAKAEAVRQVHAGLEQLPSTSKVQRTCESYVKVRSRELLHQALTESIIVLPHHQNEFEQLLLVEQVVASLEDACPPLCDSDETTSLAMSSADTTTSDDDDDDVAKASKQLSSKASLLLRVQRFKEWDAHKKINAATRAAATTAVSGVADDRG